ncbi:MAG TPA: hypothetical protein DDX85_06530 [Nitrospiraceae bacterium]|nr:hypothetical protein [Nitrospiraceae bacterium]
MATFTGGLFFAMVWLPERGIPVRYVSLLPRITFIASLLLGLLSVVLSDFMPAVFFKGGGFTQAVLLTNLFGGLFFIAAAAWFINEYIRDKAFDTLLFFFNSVLFGLAGIFFYFSDLWDIGWWHWHAVRIAAYLVAMYYAFNMYKELTEQIQVQKHRAQRYLDIAASILAVLDVQEKVVLINRKGCILLGYEEEESTGRNWFDTFLPERSRNDARLFFRKLIAAGIDQYTLFETPVLTKKGTERLVAWQTTLLRDEVGNINSILISGEDVTERKKAEEELWRAHQLLEARVKERTAELEKSNILLNEEIQERRTAEKNLQKEKEKLRTYLDISATMVVILDSAQKVTLINKKGCEILGYLQEEIIGKNWFDSFLPERLREEVKQVHAKLMAGDIDPVEYYENEVLTKDGEEKIVAWYNTFFCDEAGHITATLGTGVDITDQKKTEKALRISEERFRGAFESAAIGIGMVSPEGRWLKVNSALSHIVGYSEQELLSLTFQDITHPEDLDADLEYVRQMLAGEIRNYHMEKRYVHKEGHIVWILLSVSLVRDEHGAPLHFVSQIQDITKRKQAEIQIAASLKEKEVLLQEIHHRVKNNMTVISSLIKLQSDKVTDEHYKELFNESTNRIKTMALIHEKLYRSDDLARIVFSDYLKDMIDNILGSYGINARKVHIKKELERITLPLDISIPCGLIVNELLSNALKYAFPNGNIGEILVSLRKNNGNIELTLSDDGVGLPVDLDFRNTGSLGLNIVNALVRQIKGDIELHREQGTEFLITFRGDTQ